MNWRKKLEDIIQGLYFNNYVNLCYNWNINISEEEGKYGSIKLENNIKSLSSITVSDVRRL